MNQDEIDIMMKKIDRKCKLPKHWNEFICEQTKKNNIIIKNIKTKNFYCTHCNKSFHRKKLNVGELYCCPHCNVISKVYGSNYNRKSFKTSVTLLQRMDKQIIIRIFEIYSYFHNEKKKLVRDINEYVRIIPGVGTFLGDNTYIGYMGYLYIYNENPYSWYKYKGCKIFSHFPTYPFNKKRLIKGTKLEYAPIKEFQERFYYYNFIDTLQFAAYDSFELLWKLKLYNLSKYADKFNKNGSFYDRFKVPRNFLKFMQDNDVEYWQLRVIQLLKNEGVENMKNYIGYNYGYNNLQFFYKQKELDIYIENYKKYDYWKIERFKEIAKFVSLKKLLKYKQGMENLCIYRDYLEVADKLALNYKSKEDLFPEDLIVRHDELQKKLKVVEDVTTCFGTYIRYLELSKYTYEGENYIIFPAPSVNDMKIEGKQQGNCVATQYLNKYKDRETEIYFIRKLDNITKSFITLEYNNGKVVQKELAHHSKDFSEEQLDFIDKWCQFRKFIDKKEKYNSKNMYKNAIKYDLQKLVS